MRVLSIVALLLLCQPLLAEDTSKVDPFADQIVTLKGQYGSDGIHGFFQSQIFNMELWYRDGWTHRVKMSWALWSASEESMDDNNWLGLLVEYLEPPVDNPMRMLGRENKNPNIYINAHHKDQTAEAHFYYPAIAHTEGRSLYPWIELDWLRLYDINPETQVYLRGSTGLHRATEGSIGISYQNGPYGAKIDSQGTWSVSYTASSSTDF